MVPCQTVAVNLIGPWNLKILDKDYKFRALTAIDQDTNFVDAVLVRSTQSMHVAMKFEIMWMAKYLKPLSCVHNQGSEFIGIAFQPMLAKHGIKSKSITALNPAGNSICERMHQTMGNQP